MQTPTRIDPTTMTDAELGPIYALRREGKLTAAPDEPVYSVAEMIGQARARPEAYEVSEWVIEGGYAQLFRFAGTRNCELELAIAPEARRSGLGTLFVAFLAEQARAGGCSILAIPVADERGAAFAASLGARLDNSWHISVLPLPAEVRPVPVPGYTVRSWQDAAPAELLESLAASLNAINDAPHVTGADPWLYTAEGVRDSEAKLIARGMQSRVSAVLDDRGEVVGSTWMRVGSTSGSVARTGNTAVLSAHRGRGLGRWLKAESLTALMAARPDVSLVRTSNAVTNAAMLAVNRAVGFKSVSTWTNAVIDL
jgi:mycothiol synthase